MTAKKSIGQLKASPAQMAGLSKARAIKAVLADVKNAASNVLSNESVQVMDLQAELLILIDAKTRMEQAKIEYDAARQILITGRTDRFTMHCDLYDDDVNFNVTMRESFPILEKAIAAMKESARATGNMVVKPTFEVKLTDSLKQKLGIPIKNE